MKATVFNCLDCPMARHLDRARFSCGNSVNKVVRGHHLSTTECHDAVVNHPERCLVAHKVEETSTSMRRYFPSLSLPELHGLEPEWICDRIQLSLNWLDVFDDAPRANDGEIAIEVSIANLRIGYLRRDADVYYCDRLVGIRSADPYWLALHLVHPDYLFGVPDEIVTERELMPDYI
jgi:hypothetical protein